MNAGVQIAQNTTDDIALAIAYLASNWSRHVTGEVLNVNGGAVLCG